MSLQIISFGFDDTKKLKEFIYLPEKIHRYNPNYLPPIWDDEWKFYNPKHNRALADATAILALAMKDGQTCGRIMAMVPHFYNRLKAENTARFFAFECTEEPQVAAALLAFAEKWASQQGCDRLIGPYGFSDKDPQGAQIEGFEHTTVLATPNNAPYLPGFIEAAGFTKNFDCVSYFLPIPASMPERYRPIFERSLHNSQLQLLSFQSKWALRKYIVPVLRLVNTTYEPLFGFVPMTEPEMRKFAAQYLPILNPNFVKIIVDKAQVPVAFAIAMPNVSKGIQQAGGRLFPFGFLKILYSGRKTQQLDLLLGAVHPSYRGRGLTTLLAHSLFEAAHARGLTFIDSHLVLETNHLMRAEFEKMGGHIYKRYRVFSKNL